MRKLIDKRRKTVLLVECDTAGLYTKTLNIGFGVSFLLRLVYPRNLIKYISTSTDSLLRGEIEYLYRQKQRYSYIILIGHSNERVIQLCSDKHVTWPGIAEYFTRFHPRKLFLIGCSATRWLPCKYLFEAMDSLEEIFGSPIPVTVPQSLSILIMVLHSLDVKKIDTGLLRMVQFASFIFTKGLVFRKTKKQYQKDSNVTGMIWTAGEQALENMLKGQR